MLQTFKIGQMFGFLGVFKWFKEPVDVTTSCPTFKELGSRFTNVP